MNIIPAIDLLDGRCVRLLYGDYEKVTYYDVNPLELAQRYRDEGAKQIHIVDLDGAREGEGGNIGMIESIAAIDGLSVQTGGGVRVEADVTRRLDAGVDRVVTGSVAVNEPQQVASWIDKYGAGHFTIALDVRLNQEDVPLVATHGWQNQTDITLWDSVARINAECSSAVEHLLCTDISRDGAMTGPNVDLYQRCLQKLPELKIQSSGGVRHLADAEALAATGVAGMITGKALLENKLTLQELQPFLQNA